MLQRLKEFIHHKKIRISLFEKSIGMSNGSLAKPIKIGGSIRSDKLEYIFKTYPDLNPTWLLTGEGEMLKSDENKSGYSENELKSIAEDEEIRYNSKIELLQKQLEIQQQLLQEKEIRIREKEEQLRKKDIQIGELLKLFDKLANNKEE